MGTGHRAEPHAASTGTANGRGYAGETTWDASAPVRLVEPHPRLREAYIAMLREFSAAGVEKYAELLEMASADFGSHVAMLADLAKGIPRPPFLEPRKTYWAETPDGRLVAVARYRHSLEDPASHPWGQVGMDVLPSASGEGIGRCFLGQVFDTAWRTGVKSLHIKIHEDNHASLQMVSHFHPRRRDEVFVHPDGQRFVQLIFEPPRQ